MRTFLIGTWSNLCGKGYTLVELIVVLVLISVVVGFSFPRLRYSLLEDKLESSVRRLVGVVKETREKAIREHTAQYIRIDLAKNRLWVEPLSSAAAGDEHAAQRSRVIEFSENIRIVDLWNQTRGKIMEGEATIRITEKGYTEPTVIHLQAKDGRTVSLELQPFLGSIKFSEGYVDSALLTDQ